MYTLSKRRPLLLLCSWWFAGVGKHLPSTGVLFRYLRNGNSHLLWSSDFWYYQGGQSFIFTSSATDKLLILSSVRKGVQKGFILDLIKDSFWMPNLAFPSGVYVSSGQLSTQTCLQDSIDSKTLNTSAIFGLQGLPGTSGLLVQTEFIFQFI